MDAAGRVVAVLLEKRVTYACATCRHMLVAYESGTLDCGHIRCGGPFIGRGYPERESWIGLTRVCFVCGGEVDGVVDVRGIFIGICREHMPLLERMSLPGVAPPFVVKRALPIVK